MQYEGMAFEMEMFKQQFGTESQEFQDARMRYEEADQMLYIW